MKVWIEENIEDLLQSKCIILRYDAHDTDNLLAQYAHKFSIPVITMQHGHFHSTTYINDQMFWIGAPFQGFVSDYFFAWGEYMKQEAIAEGIPESKIVCVGTLKIDEYKKIENKKHKCFAVILNGKSGQADNKVLLLYAEKIYDDFGISYIIRHHPSEKSKLEKTMKGLSRISDLSESIYELANKVDFSICGNSTVIAELLYYNSPVFILHSKITIDMYERFKQLRFESYEELHDEIIELENNTAKIMNTVEDYGNYLFANRNADIHYKDTINEIISQNRRKYD